ncbi:MAG: SDR family NAD(P)-dependent oxidoreductase [Actinomycetota bacterium]|nr:SDR family NAD(P)-dependent oxidoreductase [Actinomycetota bacterium]
MLAGSGAKVVVCDLSSSDGKAVAGAMGDGVRFAAADVTSEEGVQAAVDLAVETFGGLQVVVNCAGVGAPGRVLGKRGSLSLERFVSAVDVNLVGTFNVIRLAAAAIAQVEPVDGERGVIVNTASVAAFEGQVGQAAYAASKGGVASLTLPVARDLADRLIRVVTIAPGIFDTPMLALLPEETRRSLAEAVPHPRRLGRPAEFAALVRHVVENPMLNGEVIRLDGALRMPPL